MQICAQIKSLQFVNCDSSAPSLFIWHGVSVWQQEQQHDLSDIKLIMSRQRKTSYNVPLFSHGWDYCLMKIWGVGGIFFFYRTRKLICRYLMSESCLQPRCPGHPNPHRQYQTSAEAKHGSLYRTQPQPLCKPLPIPQVPIPIPHLNLHYNKDKGRGGTIEVEGGKNWWGGWTQGEWWSHHWQEKKVPASR